MMQEAYEVKCTKASFM